ncbi:hypothetical protein SAMN06265337_2032 [Hymenobacter gelipurpurascens]|uniref:Uncharacterized protein n=1 Tax=Hymenobacter gelipurpurascens TaxID=89968 RepID=A0A212TPA3_9BACT|nr:hypothetical protein [Hymenobacter gelipurpurascens]SNC67674.1 hypothetical protein SAMN06265337_2032 [Hymenobacter gelipurpurascens]
MHINLTRDSVAMGDDVDAPHAHRFSMPDGSTLAQVLQTVLSQRYLASITGGEATWVALLEQKPIAVLAQQWQQPVLLGPDLVLPPNVAVQLHFRYRTQQDPEEVLAELRKQAV